MSEQANLQLIRDLYDAFARRDRVAVLNCIDPQAELTLEGPRTIPWSGQWHGHDGWAKFFQALGENTEDIALHMEPFAAQGDHVAMAGRYQARARSTGKPIDSPLVHLWTLRKGLVVKCQELTNTALEVAALT